MFQKRHPTCLMNVAQICWMLRGDHSQEEKDLLDQADTWFRCDGGVFSQTFRLDISQSQLISDGQTTFVQGQPWSNSGSSEVWFLSSHFRLTKERTVNTFCPVDFPPLDYEVARANIESSAGKVQSQMGFDVSFFIWVTFECFFGGLECVGKEMIKKTLWPRTREVWRWNSLEFCCCGVTFHVPIQQRNAAPVDGLKIRRFQVVWDEQKSFGCCRTTLSTIPFWMLKSLVV